MTVLLPLSKLLPGGYFQMQVPKFKISNGGTTQEALHYLKLMLIYKTLWLTNGSRKSLFKEIFRRIQ